MGGKRGGLCGLARILIEYAAMVSFDWWKRGGYRCSYCVCFLLLKRDVKS
jgi:hypothetical protein